MTDTDAEAKRLSVDSLPDGHRETLIRAIRNVLSSPIAEVTFAQVIDGLPLAEVAQDTYKWNSCPGHPLLDKHKELSPTVIDRARELRDGFDATTMKADSRLIYAFQAGSPGSPALQTRLLELVAVAVHQIAVWLHETEPHRPADDELASWRPDAHWARHYPHGYPPTLFQHWWYCDYDAYPHGLADGVGYWAEARIFGGVVLFDRRDPNSALDVDASAVYLHADRREITYRIFQLLDEQKRDLVQFLLSDETAPPACPLPVLGDLNNRQRFDPEEAPEDLGIYHDKWERLPPALEDGDWRLRNVWDGLDYVSREDWGEAKSRERERRYQM